MALTRKADPMIRTPGFLRTSLHPPSVVPTRVDREDHRGTPTPVAGAVEGLPTGQATRTGTSMAVTHRLAQAGPVDHRVDHRVEADPVSPIHGATASLLCLHETNLTARSKKARRWC